MAQFDKSILQTTESWRKAGFICAPYHGNDREDAKRFRTQFENAIDCETYNKGQWSGGDVLMGNHEGGTLNPSTGNAAAVQSKNQLSLVRSKQVLAIFIKHCLNETHASHVRSFRTGTHPAEDAWRDFIATECGGTTPETLEESIKSECRDATILGTTGFQVGSISHFTNWLQAKNNEITDATHRLTEHELAVILLGAISKTGQAAISHEARQEYIRAPADRLHLQPNAGGGAAGNPPAGARSLSKVQSAFAAMWDAAVHDLAIHPRAKSKRQSGAGNSTRVDGHETDVYFEANAATEGKLFTFNPATGAISPAESAKHAHSAFDIFLEHDHSVEELRDVFEAALSAAPQGAMTREKICFRCFGIGHTENEDSRTGTKGCPSPKRTPPRDIGAYLLLIGALAARKGRIPTDAMPSPSSANAAGERTPRRDQARTPTKSRAGWWRKTAPAARLAEEEEEEEGGEATEEVQHANKVDIGRPRLPPPNSDDPFASTVEDEADWIEPYDAEEVAVADAVPGSTAPAHAPWPLRAAIGAIKQLLVLMLWLWVSPAMLIINSLSGANALVTPNTLPSRIFVPHAGPRQLVALRPSQIVEETYWRARGYSVEYANDADANRDQTARSNGSRLTIDSGASIHCGGDPADVTEPDGTIPKVKIRVASGALQQVTLSGASTQVVKTRQSGYRETMRLKTWMHSPGLSTRLFSVERGFEDDGIKSEFNDIKRLTLKSGRIVPFLKLERKYQISARPLRRSSVPSHTELALAAMDDFTKSMQDHARLGHFSHNRVGSTIGWQSKYHGRDCAACMLNARHHARRHVARLDQGKNFTYFGQRVSSDLVVGFPPSIRHAFVAAIIFYDWGTSRIDVGYLKSKEKDAILSAFKQFESDHADLLVKAGGKVVEWHRDNELTSDDIEAHLRGETTADGEEMAERLATRSTLSVPYDKNTNPGAERAIGIILRPMRVMAAQHDGGGNPYVLWPFLMNQAVQIHNDLPTKKFDYKTSPNEACGRPVDLSKDHVMLSTCYVNVTNTLSRPGGKLAPTGNLATYLGHDERRRGHYVFIHKLNRITSTRDVTFPHNEMQFHALPQVWDAHMYFPTDARQAMGDEYQQRVPLARHRLPAQPLVPAVATGGQGGTDDGEADEDASGADVLFYYRNTPHSPPEAFTAKTTAGPIPLPKSEIDALASTNPYRERWLAAMKSDIEKKHGNKAWTYCDSAEVKSRGFRIHGGKWAFNIKYEEDGVTPLPDGFRARWVFKGFTEQYGRDYEDTFIGTIVGTTQRIMFAEAARLRCTLYDCDVRAAFTTAKMDRELYFDGPRPFTKKGQCCRCDKSVEGSKQAGNLYYKEHAQCFTEKIGLERCRADPNLYRRRWDDGSFLYVGVLVDNSLILPSSKDKLDWFLAEYRKHYTITGGEPTTKFNGVTVVQNIEKGTVSFHLKTYTEQVYRKYVSAPARAQLHPIESLADSHEKFMAIEVAKEPDPAMADKDYDGIVGCLGYIVAQGRPDCSFHVSWLQQFNASPPLAAWQAAVTVLLYLYHTREACITYGGRSDYLRCDTEPSVNTDALLHNSGLLCWSDASWGTIRSHGGHVITYMGAAICWVSRRLKVVCLSSTEAETVAGVAAVKDLRFVLHILDFFGVKIEGRVPLLIDNAGMWFNIRNEGVSGRTRYWDLWMHFTREMYQKGMLEPHKLDTTEERADIFTKAMSMKAIADYFKFRNDIMNIKST